MVSGRPHYSKPVHKRRGSHLIDERSPPPVSAPAAPPDLRTNGPRLFSPQGVLTGWFAVICWVVTGCTLTTGYSEQRTTQSNERRCAPVRMEQQLRAVSLDVIDHSHDDPLAQAARSRVPSSFSWRAIHTAKAVDILPLLNQIELAEELPASDPSGPMKLLA